MQRIIGLSLVDSINIVGPIAGSLTGTVAGFLLGLWGDRIRNVLFGPKLSSISFDPDNRDDYVVDTRLTYSVPGIDVVDTEARFVRVGIKNIGKATAHKCRAYLSKVEREHNGTWLATRFSDPGILSWSSRPSDEAFKGITIPSEMKVYFDVFRTIKDARPGMPTLAFCTNVIPFRAQPVLEDGGQFRISVVCVPDGSSPVTCQLILRWYGKWDTFSVSKV